MMSDIIRPEPGDPVEMFASMPVAELVDDLRDVHLDSQPMRERAADLLVELEAIVRDLAALGAHVLTIRERAKAWVSAHPVSGDQP